MTASVLPSDEYAGLLSFGGLMSRCEAAEKGKDCCTSAVYVHYCRRAALEPFVLALEDSQHSREWLTKECLDRAHHLSDGQDSWICVYVGKAAVSEKDRTAARRFHYQFGLGGYLQQAPPFAALSALMWERLGWAPYSKSLGARTYLDNRDKRALLGWCDQHMLCGWREIDLAVDEARIKTSADEISLIRKLCPLFNVQAACNAFEPILKKARRHLRSEARASATPLGLRP